MKWKKRDNAKSISEILAKRDLSVPDHLSFVQNLKEAVLLTKKMVREGAEITIVGDYDCDGITSSSILKLCLEEYIQVMHTKNALSVIIPNRYTEGYGLNLSIVERIDSGLMLTVDNGIAAVEQIKAAKEKGLTVIVIDHHLIRDDGKVPEADVLIDPHVNKGEFEDYCGAGLAYRFAMELNPETKLHAHFMALAGIGTVADVMPLVGDNRKIVMEALKHLADRDVPIGLNAILDALGADEYIDEGYIGFHIGPCFNAMGRLRGDGGSWMVNLITSHPALPKMLYDQGAEVIQVNEERKKLTIDCMNLVNEEILPQTSVYPVIIIEDSSLFVKGRSHRRSIPLNVF